MPKSEEARGFQHLSRYLTGESWSVKRGEWSRKSNNRWNVAQLRLPMAKFSSIRTRARLDFSTISLATVYGVAFFFWGRFSYYVISSTEVRLYVTSRSRGWAPVSGWGFMYRVDRRLTESHWATEKTAHERRVIKATRWDQKEDYDIADIASICLL